MAIICASLPALKPLLTHFNEFLHIKFSGFSQCSSGMADQSDTSRTHRILHPGPYSEQSRSSNDSLESLHVGAVDNAPILP